MSEAKVKRHYEVEKKRRQRELEKAGLAFVSGWVQHKNAERLYDLADRFGGDRAKALDHLLSKSIVPGDN